ncbi:hypothetical protein GCM10020254_20930 [Streptomyces goshikiensis]
MGTNVDCYQRAEGRYRLMPGIIEALRDRANPFSILTKGTLILRDLPSCGRPPRSPTSASRSPSASPTPPCGGPWSPVRPLPRAG